MCVHLLMSFQRTFIGVRIATITREKITTLVFVLNAAMEGSLTKILFIANITDILPGHFPFATFFGHETPDL